MLMTKTPTSELDLLQEISESTAKSAEYQRLMSLDASNAKDRYIPIGTHGDITNNRPGNLSVDISLNGGVYTTGKTVLTKEWGAWQFSNSTVLASSTNVLSQYGFFGCCTTEPNQFGVF
jgi:hypothetical protein